MTLCQDSVCEFAIAVSREIGSSRMLNNIGNRAYKARADWLNYFYSPWEPEGYKVETISDLKPYLSQFGSSHHRNARNNQIHENQSIRGHHKMTSGRIYLRVAAS